MRIIVKVKANVKHNERSQYFMEQDIKIFEHAKFGKVRVIIINGEPWFVAVDVCKVLEIKNSRDAVSKLYEDEKQTVLIPARGVSSTDTQGGYQNMTVVNEPGLYKLVFSSRKKEALEFQNWVYREVLPSIRKYGYYSLVEPRNAPVADKPVHVPNPNRVAGQHKNACLYVSAVSNGTVKFGQSCNVKARKANIQSVHKVKLGETHTTSNFSRKIACLVEQACKDIFAPYRVEGEFFRVETDRAYRVVDALDKLITALPSVLEAERANQIFDALKTLGDTPETKALLLKAENIFVDKKLV